MLEGIKGHGGGSGTKGGIGRSHYPAGSAECSLLLNVCFVAGPGEGLVGSGKHGCYTCMSSMKMLEHLRLQGVGNDRLVKEKDYRAKDCEEGSVFVIGLKIPFPEGLVLQ